MPAMLRLNDLLLLLVVILSMLAGILFPRFGSYFQPFPQYFLMILFFLSFLPIRLDDIGKILKKAPALVFLFAFFKIIALPVAVYYIFLFTAPAYAASAFLLSAVSTGVTAPFISNLVRGNTALVMVMVVVTSSLIPFTLPALVKLLLARSIAIPFAGMIRMLSFVIFLPVVAVEFLRRTAPGFLAGIMKRQYPVSLVLFALINLGVFSQYAEFFHHDPVKIVEAVLVSILLGGIYCLLGVCFFLKRPIADRIAGAVSIANMNNVLVVVFASHFFSPLEPTVAAVYLIPYFGVILVMRLYERSERRGPASASGTFPDKGD